MPSRLLLTPSNTRSSQCAAPGLSLIQISAAASRRSDNDIDAAVAIKVARGGTAMAPRRLCCKSGFRAIGGKSQGRTKIVEHRVGLIHRVRGAARGDCTCPRVARRCPSIRHCQNQKSSASIRPSSY